MTETTATSQFHRSLVDTAARWACGFVGATDVVDVATEALVAGVDSPTLPALAGVPAAQATVEVPDLLERVMDELDLPYYGPGHPTSRVLAAAGLAAEHTHGRLPARDLCRLIHSHYGHGAHPLIESLAELDDAYDTLDYSANPTEQQLDRRTLDAAHELVAHADALIANHTAADRPDDVDPHPTGRNTDTGRYGSKDQQ